MLISFILLLLQYELYNLLGDKFLDQSNLSSLKVIGSVGEPINEEAWNWYNEKIGKNNCPIVDTWWQTETGGIMISPLPNIIKCKPTYATLYHYLEFSQFS